MIFSGLAAAFTAVSSFVGGLGAIGSFLLRTAVGIGLNLLAQSLAGKPKEPGFSMNGSLNGGGDLPRSFILGKYATGGSLVWVNTWGSEGDTPNAWLTQVIALSDLPVKGLVGVEVDGKPVTYGSGTETAFGFAIPEYNNNGANLYIKFYDGTQTVADPALVNSCSTSARSWGSNRVGRGVAYAVIHARSTRNMFSGFPELKFIVNGAKLYDPSKDSTQPTGSGPQRWSDPATWGGDGDENPIVQLYNVFRGIYVEGDWLYGMQNLPAARLPVVNWIAGINKARTQVMGASGLEPEYRSSGEVTVDVPVATAIETLLSTCQGRISEIGGTYRIYLGAPDAPTVTITDGDILSTDGQSFTPFAGVADSINGIAATYPNPDDGWNMASAPRLLRPDLEARDGNRRQLAEIELVFVPYAEQVQRLMKSALEEGLRFRRHTIVLPPWFWKYAVPGEIIRWTSVRNGYIDKLMRIDGATDRGNLDCVIDITEVDPSDYDWDSDTEFQPPVIPGNGSIVVPPQQVQQWNAVPWAIKGDAGEDRRPAIMMTWDNRHSAILDVSAVAFEVRNKLSGVVEWRGQTDDVASGQLIHSNGILPLTRYEVRGRYVTTTERAQVESDWIEVLTLDIKMGPSDVYVDVDLPEIENKITEMTDWLRDGVRNTILELQRIGTSSIDEEFGTFADRQEVRLTAARELGIAKAEAKASLEAAVGTDSAMARSVAGVIASLDGKASATAVDTLTARVTAEENSGKALAGRVSQVEASLPGYASATALDSLTTTVTRQGSDITAQALRLNKVEVAMDGKAAASAVNTLNVGMTSVNGKVTTMAEAITAISAASVSGNVSTANFRMQAYGSPGAGFLSRIGLEARAGGSGNYRAAGIMLDVPDSAAVPTRVVILADQLVITDGSTNHKPFVFQSGVATLAVANIGLVRAGRLLSLNGKMDINLDQGTIEIYS